MKGLIQDQMQEPTEGMPPDQSAPDQAPADPVADPMAADQPGQMDGPPQATPEQMQQLKAMTGKIKSDMMEKTPDVMKNQVERIVTAGLKIMFDEKTHKIAMKQLNGIAGNSAPERMAKGIAALISLIESQSKGPFPAPAAIPVSVILLMELIEFMAEAGQVAIDNEFVAEATEDLMAMMMQKMKIGPSEVREAKRMMGRMASGQYGRPMNQQEGIVGSQMGQQPTQEQPMQAQPGMMNA